MKILFVCTGNICRSPMAEVIFRNLCIKNGRDDICVSGAGTHAEYFMTTEAMEALRAVGENVPAEKIKATQFELHMVNEFDHIICMTRRHKEHVGAKYENVKTLDEYAGCGDVFDPWGYSIDTYIEVCKKLQTSLEILYSKIIKENI